MTLLLLANGADTGALTAVHLLVIAALMAIVVFGMIWGSRQKRRRRAAETEAEEHQAELVDAPPCAPVAPTPLPPVEPVSSPAPPVASAKVALTQLKGLGPKAAALLGERGVGDVAALAALSDAEAAALDADLGTFSGRLSRDRWVEQAKLLTAGDIATYEKEFGKLG